MKPVYEVALAIVRRGDQWLVARRLPTAHLGGQWEFPGGKRERAESLQDAALRELYEECGVEAIAVRTLQEVRWEYEDRTVRLTPVLCRWIRGEGEPLGCEMCKWLPFQGLQQLEMPTANLRILEQLREVAMICE